MSKRDEIFNRLRLNVGEEEFEFIIHGGVSALLEIVNDDIAALYPQWVAHAKRLTDADGRRIPPNARMAVACCAMSLAVSTLVDSGASRDDVVSFVMDGYDVTVEELGDHKNTVQ